MYFRLVAMFIATAAWGGLAVAQGAKDMGQCAEAKTFEERIAACTRVLNNSKIKGEKRADMFQKRGHAHLFKDDFDRAIEDFDAALELTPKSAFALAYRSEAYRRIGQYDTSIKDATASLEIAPDYWVALANRGASYVYSGRYEQALTDLDAVQKLNPENAFILHMRGKAHRLLQRCDLAMDDLNKSMEIEAPTSDRLVDRAICARRLNRLELALSDLAQIEKLDPKSAWVREQRAEIHIDKQDYTKALAEAEALIKLDPSLPRGFAYRGEVHRLERRFDEALADFEAALSKNPKDTYSIISRGQTYAEQGDHYRAIADFDRALELHPDNIYTLEERAKSHEGLKDWAKAIDDYTSIIQKSPNRIAAYTGRARLHRRLGAFEKGLADYDKAVELNPDNYDTLFSRALFRMEREPEKAIADLKRIDQDKFNELLMRHLARAYEAAGQYDAANAEYDLWIAAKGANEMALAHRAAFFVRTGKFNEALQDLEKSEELERKAADRTEGSPTNSECFLIWSLYLKGDKDQAFAKSSARFGDLLKEKRDQSFGRSLWTFTRQITWTLNGDCYSAHALALTERGEAAEALEFLNLIGAGPDKNLDADVDPMLLYARATTLEALGDVALSYRDYSAFNNSQFKEWDGKRFTVVARERVRSLKTAAAEAAGKAEAACRDTEDPGQQLRGCALYLDENPGAVWAELSRAKAMRALGQESKAIEHLSRLIAGSPQDPALYLERGLSYAAQKFNSELAIADFTKVLELDPRNTLALVARGDVHAYENEGESARADYDKAIAIDSGFADAYAARGDYYRLKSADGPDFQAAYKKQQSAALDDYGTAIRRDARNVRAYRGRAAVHLLQNNDAKAIEDFSAILEILPNDLEARADRGRAYLKVGDFDNAIGDLTAALAPVNDLTDYKGFDLALALARARSGKGERDQAFADLAKIEAALAERDTEADSYKYFKLYIARADLHYAGGAYDQAVADYDRAFKSDNRDFDAAERRTWALLHVGELDRLIAERREGLKEFPNDGRSQGVLGLALYLKGDFKAASASFLKWLEFRNDGSSMLFRYLALARAGEPAAVKELEANAGRIESKAWPYAAVEMFLAKRDPQAVLISTSSPVEACEAAFYVGVWHVVNGSKDDAEKHLNAAATTCAPDVMEGIAARAELARLKS